jgi:hypothetical protein
MIVMIDAIKAFSALEDSTFWILNDICLLSPTSKIAYSSDMLMENGISLSISEYDHIFILCLSMILLHAKKCRGKNPPDPYNPFSPLHPLHHSPISS